ncbi:MAG: NAD-dependent epimerase/dehydratase family protein [Caldilineaceae bacterium]|nr:NAD-dependent epimerase/dehydratase family protein [Caldilineaceae bacterium]
MRIFITGASGFLGRHLQAKLAALGHDVRTVSSRHADLTRDDSLSALNHPLYDQIFHLAAWTQAGDFCLKHGGEQWVINNRINTNVLDWWRRDQPQAKLVALGTSVSYATEENLVEDAYMLGEPSDKFYAYAMSKRMLYAGLKSLAKQYELRYLYLVPSTLYGPGYHTDGRQLHFIYDLIRKILRGAHFGEPVILWGDGYQQRELVYIDDFIDMLLRLTATCDNDIYNVGAGVGYTIREFAAAICTEVGFDVHAIQYDVSAYVGAKSKVLSVEKLQAQLGALPATPLQVGIQRTVDWMRAEAAYFLLAPSND